MVSLRDQLRNGKSQGCLNCAVSRDSFMPFVMPFVMRLWLAFEQCLCCDCGSKFALAQRCRKGWVSPTLR